MKFTDNIALAAAALLFTVAPAGAQPIAVPGFLLDSQPVGELTQACVAPGSGGTFVGVSPSLSFPPPGGQASVVWIGESGAQRLVADGYNAIGDCLYDPVADVLYVSDNGLEFDGATTGDTVFAVLHASVAEGGSPGYALTVPGELAFAANLVRDDLGNVFVSNPAGGGRGKVKIIFGPRAPATFAAGLDFVGGLAIDGDGDVLVAETLDDSFQSVIDVYHIEGELLERASGPTNLHGTSDMAVDGDNIYVTGVHTIMELNTDNGVLSPLVVLADGMRGRDLVLPFGSGVAVHEGTGRLDFLASTFTGDPIDSAVHKLTPIDRLFPGNGGRHGECLSEIYGAGEVVAKKGATVLDRVSCFDGEPCDADGIVNDVCVFPLGVCLNVSDERFDTCEPTRINGYNIDTKPENDSLDAVLASVVGDLPVRRSGCYFSEGVAVATRRHASTNVRLPGRLRIRTMAMRRTPPRAPERDKDVIRLKCKPPRPRPPKLGS